MAAYAAPVASPPRDGPAGPSPWRSAAPAVDPPEAPRGGFLGELGAATPPVAAAPPADPGSARLEFHDDRSGFFKLLLRGGLLQLLTFGFYRFWFTTDVRRWLWQAIRLQGASLEYLGTGRELLVGFLIALTITVPLNILAFGASLGLEFIHPFLSLLAIVGFVIFGEFALFRARRYRLTRTVFRGVRFWMTGSGWGYALRSSLWSLATIATLGLALPWQLAALERYKMRHSHYGSLSGDFVASGGQLLRSEGWIWGVCLIVVAGVAIAVPAIPIPDASFPYSEHILRLVAGFFAALGMLLLLYPLFVAGLTRWRIGGIRFGDVSFKSDLGGLEIYVLYALNIVVIGCYLTVAAMLATAIGGSLALALDIDWREGFQQLAIDWTRWPAIGIAAYIVIAYLLIWVGQGLLRLFFLGRNLWKLTFASVTVFGLAALDNVESKGDMAGSLGEGLADALDVGGI